MAAETSLLFHPGSIPAAMLSEQIRISGSDRDTGAYASFVGQVRSDIVDGHPVTAIEYTAYIEMAEEKFQKIAADVRERYGLRSLFVKHSLGTVPAGEICLLVLTMSGHRKAAMEACNELVERVKTELPVWGKELLSEEGYQWKINQ